MKTQKISSFFFLTIGFVLSLSLVSCSHRPVSSERSIASESTKDCWNHVKGEYQSYFDSVEECIEKQDHK